MSSETIQTIKSHYLQVETEEYSVYSNLYKQATTHKDDTFKGGRVNAYKTYNITAETSTTLQVESESFGISENIHNFHMINISSNILGVYQLNRLVRLDTRGLLLESHVQKAFIRSCFYGVMKTQKAMYKSLISGSFSLTKFTDMSVKEENIQHT